MISDEEIKKLMVSNSGTRLIHRLRSAESQALGFIEYFEAIERGEYSKSRPQLRTFEKILLDKACAHFEKVQDEKQK